MGEVVNENKMKATQKNLGKFFKDIKSELKKVIWPTKKQLINNTGTVLIFCAVFGAMMWVLDICFGKLSGMVFIK